MPKKVLKETEASKNYQAAKTLLKEKGKLFDTIMDAMADYISIQDLDMRIVYENKAMKELMGAHEGEYCYTVYERRDKICEGCPIQGAYKTGKITTALRTGITKEGTPFRFENTGSVLRDEKGKVVAGIEVVRMVEEKEKALDELRAKATKLEEFKKMATERELEMVGLKKKVEENVKEIERLKARLAE